MSIQRIGFKAHPEGVGSLYRLTEGSSLRGTMFNLCNAMIGGGILGLPYAVQTFGLVTGVVLLFSIGWACNVTAWMIIYCVDATHEGSYAMMAEVLFGRNFGIMVDIVVFVNILGTCTSYMDIIADLVPSFLHFLGAPEEIQNRTHVMCFLTLFVLMPLSSLRRMGALRYVSLVCLGIIIGLVVVLVTMASGQVDVSKPDDGDAVLFGTNFRQMIVQIPVVVFAYSCHMNVPILYKELRKQTFEDFRSRYASKRMKMMCGMNVSFLAVGALYCAAASAGYLAFKQRTATDVLTNFENGQFWPAPYVKVLYCGAIVCSYPVMCFSGCQSLHRLLWQFVATPWEEEYSGESPRAATPLATSPVTTFVRLLSQDESLDVTDMASPSSPSPFLRIPDDEFAWEGEDKGSEFYLRFSDDRERQITPQVHAHESDRVVIAHRKVRTTTPMSSDCAHLAEVIAVVGITLVACIMVPDITTVFGLTGSLSCSALMFGFPGLCFLQVKQLERDVSGITGQLAWIALGYAFAIFGLVIALVCTSLILFG